MHSRHGVSVLRTLFEPALLELQRGPIELVDQLGMPLPQPFLGQELSGQTLEPRDDPAVVGVHAAMRFAALNPSYAPALEAEHATLSPPPHARSIPRKMGRARQDQERGPTGSAREPRYVAQRSNTREVSRCMSPPEYLA